MKTIRTRRKPLSELPPVRRLEYERLRNLALDLIRRLVKYEPKAINLLEEISYRDERLAEREGNDDYLKYLAESVARHRLKS
jgi:hypothetical protein